MIKEMSFAIVAALVILSGALYGFPKYNVYSQRLAGEAQLERQKYERQVAVQSAIAKKDSAQLLSEAEVLRANGVAQANKIIGESLKGNEGYLRYLWIQNLAEAEKQGKEIIYVPTEANLPVLEAGRKK